MKLTKKQTAAKAPNVEKSAEEIMRELDRDAANRNLTGWRKMTVKVIFIAYAIYMIINTLLISNATPYTRLPLYLGLTLAIGYLKFPANKKDAARENYIPWYDILFAISSVLVYGYYVVFQKKIIFLANIIGTTEIVFGILGIILLVELCRRAIGIPILCVAGAFVLYGAIWSITNNPATALRRIIYDLFYSMGTGVFSSPISVCSSFIILFIILGSFLEKTQIGTFFVDLANSIAGGTVGGPAKVAVISSALEGMYSGSSVANTVGSGSVTIPTMKRTGYKPEFAAAVEAAASTGGQIMPPIMGAAAFLMAEITGYSYFTIVIAAILPALLYFTGIFMMVHFEGKRLGLKGLPKEALPNFFKLLLQNGYMLLPIVVLVICMNHYTAGMSACFAILFSFIVSLIDKPALNRIVHGKGNGRDILCAILPLIPFAVLLVLWKLLAVNMGVSIFIAMIAAGLCSFLTKDAILTPTVMLEGLEGGTNNSVGVSTACGIAGIISGVVTMTALGTTLINVIVPLAEKGTLIALFLTMICCIILGMGVPTTANYVIMATITAPILIEMGIPMLAAHMFVFYFGIVADITPPVALAAYAGSAIAKSDPMKTAFNATRLAIAAFLIPYMFCLNPAMLLIDTTGPAFVLIIITSIVGMYMIACALEGYMLTVLNPVVRVVLGAAGQMMMYPGVVTDVVGIALAVVVFGMEIVKKRKQNA